MQAMEALEEYNLKQKRKMLTITSYISCGVTLWKIVPYGSYSKIFDIEGIGLKGLAREATTAILKELGYE